MQNRKKEVQFLTLRILSSTVWYLFPPVKGRKLFFSPSFFCLACSKCKLWVRHTMYVETTYYSSLLSARASIFAQTIIKATRSHLTSSKCYFLCNSGKQVQNHEFQQVMLMSTYLNFLSLASFWHGERQRLAQNETLLLFLVQKSTQIWLSRAAQLLNRNL